LKDRYEFGYAPAFCLAQILDPRDRGESLTPVEHADAFLVLKNLMKNPLFQEWESQACYRTLIFFILSIFSDFVEIFPI
jgi:hypothetical protein